MVRIGVGTCQDRGSDATEEAGEEGVEGEGADQRHVQKLRGNGKWTHDVNVNVMRRKE